MKHMKSGECVNKKISANFKDLSKFFKAVGEDNRLRILCLLKKRELCVCEIFESLKLSQNLVSSHLKILKDLKLIKLRRDKQKNYYRINGEVLKKYNLLLNNFLKNYE